MAAWMNSWFLYKILEYTQDILGSMDANMILLLVAIFAFLSSMAAFGSALSSAEAARKSSQGPLLAALEQSYMNIGGWQVIPQLFLEAANPGFNPPAASMEIVQKYAAYFLTCRHLYDLALLDKRSYQHLAGSRHFLTGKIQVILKAHQVKHPESTMLADEFENWLHSLPETPA